MNEHSPSFELLSSHFQSRPFRIVAPTAILPNGCVFQVVPLGLEYRPMIWSAGIVLDESRWLGTPILATPITLKRLPFSLECKRTLHHLLVLRVLVSPEITYRTLAGVMCDAESPCSVNTADEPESSSTTSHRNTKRLFLFGTSCPIHSF